MKRTALLWGLLALGLLTGCARQVAEAPETTPTPHGYVHGQIFLHPFSHAGPLGYPFSYANPDVHAFSHANPDAHAFSHTCAYSLFSGVGAGHPIDGIF